MDEEIARCNYCGEDAEAECPECGDDLCRDCLATHAEEHEDEE